MSRLENNKLFLFIITKLIKSSMNELCRMFMKIGFERLNFVQNIVNV